MPALRLLYLVSLLLLSLREQLLGRVLLFLQMLMMMLSLLLQLLIRLLLLLFVLQHWSIMPLSSMTNVVVVAAVVAFSSAVVDDVTAFTTLGC